MSVKLVFGLIEGIGEKNPQVFLIRKSVKRSFEFIEKDWEQNLSKVKRIHS
jgi:hypothetical protein